MKKVMVVLLSLLLLLGAVLPVGADAAAQITPCAPGEHKVYKDIFTFINDEKHPLVYSEREGVSVDGPCQCGIPVGHGFTATATLCMIEDGTLGLDFYAHGGGLTCTATITHNGRVIAQEVNTQWKSVTLSVKTGDTVTVALNDHAEGSGTLKLRISADKIATPTDNIEPTCTKGVVCDLCGTVVKDTLPHTYDDVLDADCNVCGETREVTYTGWLSQNGTWYYYQNGVKLKNTWVQDSVGWCYLGRDGSMATNTWAKDSVGWCYVGADGYCVTNQWRKDSVGWCYLGVDGRMVTNRWVMDSVGWCYVGADGYCVTNNWAKDSNGWCYLGADGRMLTDSWAKDSNGWCYVGSDGYCVTETWVRDSVGWCYLNENGNVAKGEWVKTNDKWYFVDLYGYMVTGKQYVDGKAYYFDIVTGELME